MAQASNRAPDRRAPPDMSLRPVVTVSDRTLVSVDLLPGLRITGTKPHRMRRFWTSVDSQQMSARHCSTLCERVGRYWTRWYQNGLSPHLTLALDAEFLRLDPGLPGLLEGLDRHGIPARKLELRLDQQDLQRHGPELFRWTAPLRSAGVELALVVSGHAAPVPLPLTGHFDAIWLGLSAAAAQSPGAIHALLQPLSTAGIRRIVAQGIDSEVLGQALPATPCTAMLGDWVTPAIPPESLLDWAYANRWQRALRKHPEQPRPEEAATAGDEHNRDRSGQGHSALIIDDDPLLRETLSAQLRSLGVTDCEVAGDGIEARELLLKDDLPSMVFVDLKMPGMDGIEFLRDAAQRFPQLPVVLVSGVDDSVMRAAASLTRAHNLTLLGTLQKPFRLTQLQALLHRMDRPDDLHGPVRRVVVSVAELREALADDALHAYFQPQARADDGQLCGAEVLMRWEHASGLLFPGQFYALAVENDLSLQLNERVTRAALSALSDWRAQGLDIGISLNLSRDLLGELSLPERLWQQCQEFGIAPADVTLEIAESNVCEESGPIIEVATRLSLRGFVLAIDDFGKGASSLSQLQTLPFSQIKIDGSLVSTAQHDTQAQHIVASNIELARRLGMRCVAKGVERIEDWRLLRQLGCDAMQGFLLSPALPARDFPRWAQADYPRRLQRGEPQPA